MSYIYKVINNKALRILHLYSLKPSRLSHKDYNHIRNLFPISCSDIPNAHDCELAYVAVNLAIV
jgi:hypothetical protein